MLFVIEHLEPVVSKWVWYEYKHASRIVGKENLIITNVKDPREAKELRKIAIVSRESIIEVGAPSKRLIILDPQAKESLRLEDFKEVDFIVVGGIMGDHPPRGRTFELLTKRIPGCKARNIGKEQFSVDGAIYIALMISEGISLEEIPIVKGLEIKVNEYLTIELPYAFPLVNNRPLISEELIEYLKYDIEEDEVEAIRMGRVKSIVEY